MEVLILEPWGQGHPVEVESSKGDGAPEETQLSSELLSEAEAVGKKYPGFSRPSVFHFPSRALQRWNPDEGQMAQEPGPHRSQGAPSR